jgi:hypothetical protein
MIGSSISLCFSAKALKALKVVGLIKDFSSVPQMDNKS